MNRVGSPSHHLITTTLVRTIVDTIATAKDEQDVCECEWLGANQPSDVMVVLLRLFHSASELYLGVLSNNRYDTT